MKTLDRILHPMLALFLLTVSPAFAVRPYTPVHPDPVLEPWRWRTFPELNGLGLRCMAEATDKAMWFGVDDGARRYDGVKWTAYTEKDGLYGTPVNALCATRDGSIYAGTAWGISRFKDGKWRRVFPPEGDPSTPFDSLALAQGRLRQAQDSELALSETKGQVLPWPTWDLMEAKDGSVWAGTLWGALRLSPEGATLYTAKEKGDFLRGSAPYVTLAIVPEEAVPLRPWGEWIGVATESWSLVTYMRGVIYALAPGGPGEAAGLKVGDRITALRTEGAAVRLTIQREGQVKPFEVTVTRRQVEGTYRNFTVYDVYEDREGRMWFGIGGSDGGEIVCYTPSTSLRAGSPLTTHFSEWRLYTEKDGLDIGFSPRIAQSRDGTVWTISHHGLKGVNRFDGKTWSTFKLSDLGGNDHNISIVETRDGTVWVSGWGGILHAYRKGSWTVYGASETPTPQNYIFLLEASDGALWIGGVGQEAVRLDYGTARWRTYESLAFQCETPDGAQWFVSQDSSVVRHDGRTWTRYGVEDGLMDSPGRLIVNRENVLWAAGSHDSTAATARFDGKRWFLQTHPRLSWSIYPFSAYESSDGTLWFGANNTPNPERGQVGGILQFDGKTWTHHTPPTAPPIPYGIGGDCRRRPLFRECRWPAPFRRADLDARYGAGGVRHFL